MLHKEAWKLSREHNPWKPGRFEGQSAETVYFHNLLVNGGSDERIGRYDLFRVESEESEEFELFHPYFAVWTDEAGFTYGTQFSEAGITILRSLHLSEAGMRSLRPSKKFEQSDGEEL